MPVQVPIASIVQALREDPELVKGDPALWTRLDDLHSRYNVRAPRK